MALKLRQVTELVVVVSGSDRGVTVIANQFSKRGKGACVPPGASCSHIEQRRRAKSVSVHVLLGHEVRARVICIRSFATTELRKSCNVRYLVSKKIPRMATAATQTTVGGGRVKKQRALLSLTTDRRILTTDESTPWMIDKRLRALVRTDSQTNIVERDQFIRRVCRAKRELEARQPRSM
jgi:hypothetical protein